MHTLLTLTQNKQNSIGETNQSNEEKKQFICFHLKLGSLVLLLGVKSDCKHLKESNSSSIAFERILNRKRCWCENIRLNGQKFDENYSLMQLLCGKKKTMKIIKK